MIHNNFNFDSVWKSNYNFTCKFCNKNINRGEYITKIINYSGITLRTQYYKNGFFTKNSNQHIVHTDCNTKTKKINQNQMTFYSSKKKLDDLQLIIK